MTETAKTITFVAIGLVAITLALVTRPTTADLDVESLVGEVLTKKFDSADAAKRLRIVRFDEDTATLREFEVAEEDGLWSIPSKDGYPADARRQMAEAATSLMDREILAVVSHSAGDHEQFGVVDPLSPRLEVGQKGVGTRVTMADADNAALADLIIGRRVRDAAGQRYVREAGRDVVYVIEIDSSKLSTSFEDWIERDLLKLNPWDLARVEIKDYSAELVPAMTPDGRLAIQVAWDPRSEMTLAYDDSQGEWSAERLRRFDPSTEDYVEFTLAEDEELDTATLNKLKDALDDLEIVDVVRKPQGLSDDLKAGGDFLNNVDAQRSLMSKGFVTASAAGSGDDEIISSDGEVIATLKNGTEYVLRFGNLTNVDSSGEVTDDELEPVSPGGNDVHRYLFVMARFNEAAVEKPELQEVPELPAEAEPSDPAGGAEPTAETESASGDAERSADDGQHEAAADDGQSTAETPASEAAAEAVDDVETTSSEAEANEEPAEETTATEDPDADGDELERLIAEQKRIEADNQRKLDEYQETLDQGRERVAELNTRFGDWYFVVANDVFNNIRLSREAVVKKKDPADEGEPVSVNEFDIDAADVEAPIFDLPEIPVTNE